MHASGQVVVQTHKACTIEVCQRKTCAALAGAKMTVSSTLCNSNMNHSSEQVARWVAVELLLTEFTLFQ